MCLRKRVHAEAFQNELDFGGKDAKKLKQSANSTSKPNIWPLSLFTATKKSTSSTNDNGTSLATDLESVVDHDECSVVDMTNANVTPLPAKLHVLGHELIELIACISNIKAFYQAKLSRPRATLSKLWQMTTDSEASIQQAKENIMIFLQDIHQIEDGALQTLASIQKYHEARGDLLVKLEVHADLSEYKAALSELDSHQSVKASLSLRQILSCYSTFLPRLQSIN
jgi:hypothetical protein